MAFGRPVLCPQHSPGFRIVGRGAGLEFQFVAVIAVVFLPVFRLAQRVPFAEYPPEHARHLETDLAFEWLSKACDERAEHLPYLKVLPRVDVLRDDARFDDVLRKLGLAEPA